MIRPDSLDKRLSALEAKQPYRKTKGERFCERCTTEELDRLVPIAEKQESGEPLTVEEKQFYDDLLIRRGWWADEEI